MKKIRIELEIEVKGDATFDEVEEFMEYEMHLSGCCGGTSRENIKSALI